MGKDFVVTITDPERAAEWLETLGTTTACVRSPIPERASLPGHPNALVYMLDLDLITQEQRERLIAHIARKFGLPEAEVREGLAVHGVPILDEHCTVTVFNPQKWF